jgi:hypothetical protein
MIQSVDPDHCNIVNAGDQAQLFGSQLEGRNERRVQVGGNIKLTVFFFTRRRRLAEKNLVGCCCALSADPRKENVHNRHDDQYDGFAIAQC